MDKKQINQGILKTTTDINESNPELLKFLDEMTVTIPDEAHPDISKENLEDYFNTLNLLWNKYLVSHQSDSDK